MKLASTLVALALLTLIAPVAAAAPDLPDLSGDGVRAGDCQVRWSWWWPGETLGATCTNEGQTLVAFSYGTCALGHYVYVQVGNGYAYLPCDPAWTWTILA